MTTAPSSKEPPRKVHGTRRRHFRFPGTVARPRLAFSSGLFLAVAGLLALLTSWSVPTIVLTAWNVAVATWLASAFAMMATSDAATTLRRARRVDADEETILVLSVVAAIAGLVAVVGELAVVRGLGGLERAAHVGLAAVTVVTAWTFIQAMFAIHYAHMDAIARDEGRDGGFRIPNEETPDYWDFLYVAAVIGTSGQTADVAFTTKTARRTTLAHAVFAFFFNTSVLALMVNIAAGVLQ